MRFIGLAIIALLFMLTPVYLLSELVMPELLVLRNVYADADVTARQIVTAR